MRAANSNHQNSVTSDNGSTAIMTSTLTAEVMDEAQWLLLAELSHGDRWVFWIVSSEWPTVDQFLKHDVNPCRVLLIHRLPGSNPSPIIERALQAGTCSAVLVSLDSSAVIEDKAMMRIERIARDFDALAIPLHTRTTLNLAA